MVAKDRLDNSLAYIKDNYNISNLLKEWGCPTNKKTIACPLHSDITPSCAIDIENNRYHCFSCGSYGSYVNLLYEYRTKVEGKKSTFSQIVDGILKSDERMQSVLGFSTLFVEERETFIIDDYLDMKYKPYQPKYVDTFSVDKIYKSVRNDVNDLLDYFACIEKGLPISMIYDKFVNHSEVVPISTVNEIMSYGEELSVLLNAEDVESNYSEFTGELHEDIDKLIRESNEFDE